ncbi:MAG: cob(I)yrinic acid a,c-diamide adenosyltransferase [Methanomassiliicoccales archaeon]|nr:cob(I)yrinic acid a,c-diamide adenosyltransferase [Methanomassiliicoccales archaeon]
MGDRTGLVHVYTGDGKGRTTAALGMCIRTISHTALVVQFMKTAGTYGESFLDVPGLNMVPSGRDCQVF